MDQHSCRRLKSVQHSNASAPLAPFDMLPDEMHVHVFQYVDSVTRLNVQRVCRRWKSILRETLVLQKTVLVDVNILPLGTPLQRQQQQRKATYKYSPRDEGILPDDMLTATVRFLLKKHPAADKLYVFGPSTSPTASRVLQQDVDRVSVDGTDGTGLISLALDNHGTPSRVLKAMTLDKLEVDMLDMALSLMLYVSGCDVVVLRDVQVTGLHIGNPGAVVGRPELRRTVRCRIVTGPSAASTFVAALAESDAPLDASEEHEFQQLMSTLQQMEFRCGIQMIAMRITLVTDHDLTDKEIVTGSGLNAFWKRLVIAGQNELKRMSASGSF